MEGGLRLELTLPMLPALLSSVPEGTDMFEVYGTPGVDIYVSPSMERSRERADTRRWCFNKGLEIIVVMNSPSNDLNDSHVSSPPGPASHLSLECHSSVGEHSARGPDCWV